MRNEDSSLREPKVVETDRQQRMSRQAERIETVGIGDSINDAPLLAMVDYPILVQKPDGSYDPDIHLSKMIRASGIGPVGWNEAVLELLVQAPKWTA